MLVVSYSTLDLCILAICFISVAVNLVAVDGGCASRSWIFIMWCKEEDVDLSMLGAWRERHFQSSRVKIDLPCPFSGDDDKQSFLCWARQFEVAVRALVEGDGGRSYHYELA